MEAPSSQSSDSTLLDAPSEPRLDAIEIRILGSLIEKQATNPETYPLTLNALVLACNQKTSREPVMSLTQGQVGHSLRALEGRGFTRLVMGRLCPTCPWVRLITGSRLVFWLHASTSALSVSG